MVRTQEPGGNAVVRASTTSTDSIRLAMIFRAASHSQSTGNSSSTCTGGTRPNIPPAAIKSSMLLHLPRCKDITPGYGPCTRFRKAVIRFRISFHGQKPRARGTKSSRTASHQGHGRARGRDVVVRPSKICLSTSCHVARARSGATRGDVSGKDAECIYGHDVYTNMNAERWLCVYAMEGMRHCCERENVLTTVRRFGLIVACMTGPLGAIDCHVLSEIGL